MTLIRELKTTICYREIMLYIKEMENLSFGENLVSIRFSHPPPHPPLIPINIIYMILINTE